MWHLETTCSQDKVHICVFSILRFSFAWATASLCLKLAHKLFYVSLPSQSDDVTNTVLPFLNTCTLCT